MAHPSLLLRFRIALSDIDRARYEELDFRIAQHPSETTPFLLSRVLAYALNIDDGLEFAPGGISDTDDPCLSKRDPTSGGFELCIEVGSPSAKRIHKDMKAARRVKIYTFKNPEAFLREISGAAIHKVEELEVYSFDSKFLDRLAARLVKDNRWSIVHSEGSLTVSIGEDSEATEICRHFAK